MLFCVRYNLLDIDSFSSRPRAAHANGVHKELGQAHQLRASSDERRCDDVVHEKRAVVRKEDATESELEATNN